MASAERQPIRGSGGGAPAGPRGRAPGQGVRGAKPPEAERFFRHYTSKGQAIFAPIPNF